MTKNIEKISLEINDLEDNISMKNYYLFKPFEFVTSELQADKNWFFECEDGSREDLFAKQKNGLFLSDYIRKLDFVSRETTLNIIEKFLKKAEVLKKENEVLKKENNEMKQKILEFQSKV